MARSVKRLLDLEIDEVSLVDRPANQHGLVTITKNWEGTVPEDDGIFDAEGYEVDEGDLEPGDVVYNGAGEEFVIVDEDELAELQAEGEHYDPEMDTVGELAGVGKAMNFSRLNAVRRRKGFGAAAQVAGRQAGRSVDNAAAAITGGSRSLYQAGRANPKLALGYGAAGLGTAGAGGYAVGNRRRGVEKSLGDSVLEELSKALNEDDRSQVIAKAMDEVQRARQEAAEAWQVAKSLEEQREFEGFRQLAGQYQVPVDPDELASVLYTASQTLSKRDQATLHRVLSAQSEVFEELGVAGYQGGSEVMDTVQAYALEAVGKSDLSQEQAITALFDANPAAYDEYLAEQRY